MIKKKEWSFNDPFFLFDYAYLAERKIILRIPPGRGEFRKAKFFVLLFLQ